MTRIVGTEGNDPSIYGGAGNDRIFALGGSDAADGQGGGDIVYGGTGNDRLNGGDGGDVLYGQAGDDNLSGDRDLDYLYGGSGNDYLYGGDGFDRLYGGAGRDILVGDAQDELDGGAGIDTLSLSYIGQFTSIRFSFNPEAGPVRIGAHGTAINVEQIDITGGNIADILRGGNGNDALRGWEGNDQLFGRGGNDLLIGDNGADQLNGGDGNDTLAGGGGDDTLIGGNGDDILIGGKIFDLYSGRDLMEGGAGADSFYSGPGQTDITYAHSRQGVTVDLRAGVGHGGDAEGDHYYLLGGQVIGSAHDDTLIGGREQFGGDGDDHLVQTEQTYAMTGGNGADTFAFYFVNGGNYGREVAVHDFQQGVDIIDLSGVDANPAPGDQGFTFIGTDDFGTRANGKAIPGQLHYFIDGGQTVVELQVDKDIEPEFSIRLDGVYTLTAADFHL